jgi:hypothetical protein
MKSINQMSAEEYKQRLLTHPEEIEQELKQQTASKRVVWRAGSFVYEDGMPAPTSGEQTPAGSLSPTKAAYNRPLV